jgi:hypothetical protein
MLPRGVRDCPTTRRERPVRSVAADGVLEPDLHRRWREDFERRLNEGAVGWAIRGEAGSPYGVLFTPEWRALVARSLGLPGLAAGPVEALQVGSGREARLAVSRRAAAVAVVFVLGKPAWEEADGGELGLFLPDGAAAKLVARVRPLENRLFAYRVEAGVRARFLPSFRYSRHAIVQTLLPPQAGGLGAAARAWWSALRGAESHTAA